MDYFEGGYGSLQPWIARSLMAKQMHRLNGRIYMVDVEAEKDFLGKKRFSLIPALDDVIRHQIVHAILEVNPTLPHIV